MHGDDLCHRLDISFLLFHSCNHRFRLLHYILLTSGDINALWQSLEAVADILSVEIVDLSVENIYCAVTKVNLRYSVGGVARSLYRHILRAVGLGAAADW